MNVLMLINSFRLGGAEKVAYDIAKNIQLYSECNMVLCSMGGIEDELEKNICKELRIQGIHCLSLNKPRKRGRILTLIKLQKIVKQYNIDIIHTNGQSPDFYARLLRILNNKIKVLTTIHNTDGYSRMIEMLQQSYTDKYTAVSLDAEMYAKNRLGVSKKIAVIENGIYTNNYQNITRTDSSFVIISVGRLAEQKGYQNAVKMLAPFLRKHRDVIWKIYGDYEEHKEYYQNILDMIYKEGINDSVKFMGVCTNASQIYCDASCFVLASDYEGFGIAFIEAMATGIPVFANKVGCLNDIYDMGGFFYDLSKVNVTDSLEKIYCNPNQKKEILKLNQNIIKEHYDISIIAKKYLLEYQEMMGL